MSKAFRRRDARHSWELHYGPNMTPMVDVVMVILIFFMASASFVGAEWFLKTAIPKQAAAEQPPKTDQGDPYKLAPAKFEVTLSPGADGRTAVSGPGFEGLKMADLPVRLKELAAGVTSEDLVLVIRPEAGVPYGDVIRAHDAAASAGIAKVGLMDAPPPGTPPRP
jgi:biopolymer transport protein ExbD